MAEEKAKQQETDKSQDPEAKIVPWTSKSVQQKIEETEKALLKITLETELMLMGISIPELEKATNHVLGFLDDNGCKYVTVNEIV